METPAEGSPTVTSLQEDLRKSQKEDARYTAYTERAERLPKSRKAKYRTLGGKTDSAVEVFAEKQVFIKLEEELEATEPYQVHIPRGEDLNKAMLPYNAKGYLLMEDGVGGREGREMDGFV